MKRAINGSANGCRGNATHWTLQKGILGRRSSKAERSPRQAESSWGVTEEFAEEKTVVEDADGIECEAWTLLEISE